MARTSRLRRIAIWISLAASLGAALVFIAARGALPSDGARVDFYGRGWSAVGVAIAPIDVPAEGLAAGDVVTAVDGRSLEAWVGAALDPEAERPDVARPVQVDLLRSGMPLSIRVGWAPPSIAATLTEGWSVIVLSAAFAAIAAFVFARRPDEPVAAPLVVAACAIAGSSVPWFMGLTVSEIVRGWPYLLHSVLTGPLYMLLWPALLHIGLVFPARPSFLDRRPWIIPAVWVAGLGAYALLLLVGRVASPTTLEWLGTWPIVQMTVLIPMLTLTLALMTHSYVRTTDPVARVRIRWVTLGGVLSATIGLAVFWLPELVLRRPLVDHSWIGLVALPFPLGLAAAILRDRLFDIDVVVNRTLVYGGLTLGVLASYAAAVSALGVVVGPEHGYGVSLLATGMAALLALPLRDALQRSVNRLMYGDRDEPWRVIRRLGRRLEWAAEPDRAFPAIAETVADALRLPYVALEIAEAGDDGTIVTEHGTRRGPTITLPLVHGGDPVGRLILGVRAGERRFRDDELGLLEDLARQAGAAIHAIRLQQDLVRSREALVVAREEERRRLRRDLHDGLGPSLAAIGLRAEASAATLASDPDGATRLLEELGDDVRTALADIRRLVDGLRPPALDELGLLGAIEQQAGRLEAGTSFRVDGAPVPLPELPAAVEVAAYRIAVEAVTNVVRHAGATTCRVRVEAGEALTVEVTDDGCGIPADAVAGIGLESIRARAEELGGSWRLERPAGGGTRVVAHLPLVAAPGART